MIIILKKISLRKKMLRIFLDYIKVLNLIKKEKKIIIEKFMKKYLK